MTPAAICDPLSDDRGLTTASDTEVAREKRDRTTERGAKRQDGAGHAKPVDRRRAAGQRAPVLTDSQAIQGTWKVVTFESGQDHGGQYEMVVIDASIFETVPVGGRPPTVIRGPSYRLDPRASPKTIDLFIPSIHGSGGGASLGIYELARISHQLPAESP